jgi:hypothetical protein
MESQNMMHDAIAVTVQVTKVLEAIGVRYFIGGSIASTLYGMVRTTQDSDIIADLSVEHIPVFMANLQHDFYVDDEMIADAISHRSSFNIIHKDSMFKVDVFVPHIRTFISEQFARAREEALSSDPQMTAYVASPEDIILAKLEWYRLGGEVSERQWRDVLGVIKVQGEMIDTEYLHGMATELNLEDLLVRALTAGES